MVKLSIVIPYFETYELTEKLLDVLVPQLTNEIEVILIDDGCSEKRLDKYNLNVIHQDNKGVAITRNKGIILAKGKYIGFIDCDDMITNDYIDTLINAIDKYDTDVINFNWLDLTTKEEIRRPTNPAVWKAIYKKDIIWQFKEDMPYGSEDFVFQVELDKKIKENKLSITYLDKLLYMYYSNRQGSLIWKKLHKEKGMVDMVKCEVIEPFTLVKFDELQNIQRKSIDTKGRLYVGDVFECEEQLADYLMGKNDKNKVVVKVIEVIPKKLKTEAQPITEEKPKKKRASKK